MGFGRKKKRLTLKEKLILANEVSSKRIELSKELLRKATEILVKNRRVNEFLLQEIRRRN